jgi:hypothetical protein
MFTSVMFIGYLLCIGFGMCVMCCGGIAPMLKIEVLFEANKVVAIDVLDESLILGPTWS